MNEYIFYTAEGYTYPPIEGKDIGNCQVLGRSYGKNAKEARNNLEKQCPWIKDCGFDIEEVMSKQLLSEDNKKDINTVIEYLMGTEYHHYQESEEAEDHIYHTLLRLKKIIS